jgi:hypothetical protein
VFNRSPNLAGLAVQNKKMLVDIPLTMAPVLCDTLLLALRRFATIAAGNKNVLLPMITVVSQASLSFAR